LRQLRSTERLLSCRVPPASPADDDRHEDEETDRSVENTGDPDADQFGDADEIRNDEEDEYEALPSLDSIESGLEGGFVHTGVGWNGVLKIISL